MNLCDNDEIIILDSFSIFLTFYFCTQSALNTESKRPQTQCLWGFVVSIYLFKLGPFTHLTKHICLVLICKKPMFYLYFTYYFGY